MASVTITEATFKRSVTFHEEHPRFEYKGQRYFVSDGGMVYRNGGRGWNITLHNNCSCSFCRQPYDAEVNGKVAVCPTCEGSPVHLEAQAEWERLRANITPS